MDEEGFNSGPTGARPAPMSTSGGFHFWGILGAISGALLGFIIAYVSRYIVQLYAHTNALELGTWLGFSRVPLQAIGLERYETGKASRFMKYIRQCLRVRKQGYYQN